MGLNKVRLLIGLGLLLAFAKLLDQTHGLALQAAVEPAASTCVDDIAELIGGEIQELVEIDTAVRELAESSLLLDLGSLNGVVFVSHDCVD